MANTFTLRIMAPQGVIAKEEVISATIITAEGDIGVLTGHADYIGLLGIGVSEITLADGTKKKMVTRDGFCKIKNGACDIIADKVLFEKDKQSRNLDAEIESAKVGLDKSDFFDPTWDVRRGDVLELESLKKL